ncbi:SGNH/GDSL hydrolase family protein [Desulfonema ishimotonii]|uniref:SGNH/GDSL hydrolase family protein n=1 Tax=Desulfonema ishimotonii TaxID=45657 RepID=UPI0014096F8A|nr:SGNH/GDSL hydrolase family protein [Desulfonema ishimotonii]
MVVFACTLITIIWTASASAVTYDRMVVFGDSLSDHYGLYTYLEPITGAYDAVTNPDGVREVWSNGDVWAEYLATLWNAELDNRAIAGAMTQGHENSAVQAMTDSGTLPALGIRGQVNTYLDETGQPLSDNTLYVIWIGGNDLLVYGEGRSDAATAEEMISDAITNITAALGQLYDAGARKFLVMNLPDIGATPAYLNLGSDAGTAATALSESFNSALHSAVKAFAESENDETIHWTDVFTFLHQITDDGTFANTTGTYLVLDEEGRDTGAVNEPASDYLYWNGIHPTTRTHSLLADFVDEQLDDDSGSDSCFIGAAAFGPVSGSVWGWGALLLGVGAVSCRRKK